MFINGLLKEVEQPGLGVDLLFADDFVGVSDSEEEAYQCGTCLLL